MSNYIEPDKIPPQKCFCCDRSFDIADEFVNTPWPATSFTSRGNWGSTVIDLFNEPGCIEIYICDVCLTQRKDKITGWNGRMNPEVRDDVMKWYNKE